jgi:hypothetical protein
MMITTQEEKRQSEQKKQERGLLEAVISDKVLSELGRPDEMFRVQVTCVWGDNYRVNVFVGPDLASLKVAHSYFLKADGNGKILSSPAIERVY